jgi:hypothetical protein
MSAPDVDPTATVAAVLAKLVEQAMGVLDDLGEDIVIDLTLVEFGPSAAFHPGMSASEIVGLAVDLMKRTWPERFGAAAAGGAS